MSRSIDWNEITEGSPSPEEYRKPFCEMIGDKNYFYDLEWEIYQTRGHLSYVKSKLRNLEERLAESDRAAELMYKEAHTQTEEAA